MKIKINDNIEFLKELEKTTIKKKLNNTPEYKKLVKESNNKIAQARKEEAKIYQKSKKFIVR